MWPLIVVLTFNYVLSAEIPLGIWDSHEPCPIHCKCWEEHFFDLPLYRHSQKSTHHEDSLSDDYHVTNDIFLEEEEDNENNPLLKVVTCLLTSETGKDPKEFISTIPKNAEVLTILEGAGAENKTLFFSYFQQFNDLIGLDIQGLRGIPSELLMINKLAAVVDMSLVTLKYLNLNDIVLKNSKSNHKKIEFKEETGENSEEIVTIIGIQGQDEILPYSVYKRKQKNLEVPTFSGFKNLILLRVCSCNLQNICWEMFEDLKNLQNLILEDNHLKFIPDFAFFGTPNLQSLSLARNNLLNIQITDLAGLLELEYLDLSCNNFSQLSELSFPPFPKLKLADFKNNPITVIFPNTFDVMNTTDSMILGGEEVRLELLPNSFLGLNKLVKLTILNVSIPILKREFFNGLPELQEIIITGNIDEIEFDAFAELKKLEKLILHKCNIYNVSMDSFYGLKNLRILDLSRNHLKSLPPGVFDQQVNLKELILNGNELTDLPKQIFQKMFSAKLIRLNENPWHCSCVMNDWNPMIVNKIKQKILNSCDAKHDKGINCANIKNYRYVYENRVTPKCQTPNKFKKIGVFQVIRKQLHCNSYRAKIRKAKHFTVTKKIDMKFEKIQLKNDTVLVDNKIDLLALGKNENLKPENDLNNLNALYLPETQNMMEQMKGNEKLAKLIYKKRKQHILTMGKLKKMKKDRKFKSEI